jgi:hypothetical protein
VSEELAVTTLTFTDDLGPRHFEFCFVGFVLGGSLLDRKGITILRREMQLFEKLEAISEVKPCGKKLVNGEADRQLLKEGERQLQIDGAEFDMLYNYIAAVPWQSGSPVRHALDTLDWLTHHGRS